jgi:energy-converting hydrogenase B subunit D
VSGDAQELLLLVLLGLLAVVATVAALTRDPRSQALVLSAYSLVMGLVILVFHAPDVALSELGIGAAVVPLIILLAIRTCERQAAAANQRREQSQSGGSDDRRGATGGSR